MDSVAPAQDPRQGIYWLAELDSPPGILAPIAGGLRRTLGPSPGPPPLRLLSFQLIDRKAPTTSFIVLGSPFPFTGERSGQNEVISIPTNPFAHLHGYALEFFGVLAPNEVHNERIYRLTLPRIGERSVEMWRQRAFVKDCKLYAELRWHPGGVPELARIGGLETKYTPKQLLLAERAIALLRRIPKRWPKGGRPAGSKDYTEATKLLFFRRVSEKSVEVVLEGNHRRLNKTSLARAMMEGEKKIGEAVDRFHVDLEAIEKQILDLGLNGTDRETIIEVIFRELMRD